MGQQGPCRYLRQEYLPTSAQKSGKGARRSTQGAFGDSGSFHVPSAGDGYGLTDHSPREQEMPERVSCSIRRKARFYAKPNTSRHDHDPAISELVVARNRERTLLRKLAIPGSS